MPKPKVILEAEFEHGRETKNTHRYEELSEVPAIGSLYIQKWKLTLNGEEAPKRLKVTIEEV